MDAFVHDSPATRVVFGVGSLAQVGEELERLGASRALLISGGPEAEYADRIAQALGDRVHGRFTDVVMHVPVTIAADAIEASRGADCLIALGGGSSTGMAKAVAKETGLPILAVPTTYAGSEMTSIWGLTENNRKVTGRDPKVLPKTVIYDPELTLTLPANVSAASGMNALAHLVEGLYAPWVSPLQILTAHEGVRALAVSLPNVVARPTDIDARGEALYGAWLAGWTLGTTGMGVHHKICHVLGGAYDLPHGPMHSAVLAYATEFNEAAAPGAMAALIAALREAGLEAPTAATGIWDLASRIGAPTCLADVGFDPAHIEEAAALVVEGRPVNPRSVDVDGVRGLLAAATRGSRPETT
jgi:maleylacetate reductase